jgi:type I restriction enzyme M protein
MTGHVGRGTRRLLATVATMVVTTLRSGLQGRFAPRKVWAFAGPDRSGRFLVGSLSYSAPVKSEEDVKIQFLLPYLRERGYKDACIRFEVGVKVTEGRKEKTIFADAVVYASPKSDSPLVLCETKAPDEVLDRKVREQAISYARLLPRIVPLVLVTNGAQTQVFQTVNKNRIADLPSRKELEADVVNFVVSTDLQDALRREARHELFIVDDVQTFKRVLRACHNEIRNNEGFDPVAAFDEMSKVLFCKLYEEKTNPERNRFRSAVFDDTLDRLGFNVVGQIFDETKKHPNYSGLFTPDATIALKDRTIRRIVEQFEDFDLSLTAFDVKGEAFEYFLSDTFTGGLGEYFTPRNVVEFMVDAIDPKIGDRIIDPFCGTGGFLIYAFEVVSEKIRLQEFSDEEKARWRLELSNRSLSGSDWKERTSQACKMNMMVHGDGSAGIFKHHGLLDVPGKVEEGFFDTCLTNPPFGANETDPDVLRLYELGAGRKSIDRMVLAMERAVRLIKPGGRVAIVVADGLLDNSSARDVREYIRTHTWVEGVVSLAKATFEGYGAKAKTSILFLRKKQEGETGEQAPVFMAIAEETGYAPNGAPVPGNQLPDILLDWHAFKRGEFVPSERAWVAEISDRLDPKFYRARSGTPTADVEAIGLDVSERLAELQAEHAGFVQEVAAAFNETKFETTRVGELLQEVTSKHKVEPDLDYRLLGVRWWGGGTFIREEKRGRDIKGKTLHRVDAGWFIYNRLFAFRGSFAVVPDEHAGCHVSNEFPTFVPRDEVKEKVLIPQYVAYVLNSPQYLDAIDAQSTGSTKESRNRWNQALLVDFEIQLPSTDNDLQRLVGLLARAAAMRSEQEALFERVKELRDGVSLMLPVPQ